MHTSGQIIIFHQPRFPWNKGISLTEPPFRVRSCEVAIIWPDTYISNVSNSKGELHIDINIRSIWLFHPYISPSMHPSMYSSVYPFCLSIGGFVQGRQIEFATELYSDLLVLLLNLVSLVRKNDHRRSKWHGRSWEYKKFLKTNGC